MIGKCCAPEEKPDHVITDITWSSSDIITVTLNLDTVWDCFLGISIVGQPKKVGGLQIRHIMKGYAVDLDGRIEQGDMIMKVNDVNFENRSNEDALQALRNAVQKPGPIALVVVRLRNSNLLSRAEPVIPLDPGSWAWHTNAFAELDFSLRTSSVSTYNSLSITSLHESARHLKNYSRRLSLNTNMITIAKSMASPDSGLDVRDRIWLKITIPDAFIGSEVVDWLYCKVRGLQDRREARYYANQMLKQGFIKHTVKKSSFSEHCYYVFKEALLEKHLKPIRTYRRFIG